ncbi:Ribonuclease R [Roseimaritima multifibrata]|uniref:Ribonuclease R n=1 Tax=Roseimaritima multifibrata TaxID=1930274 RepID=A0A517MLV5_9BACT|nr:ribonuclease R [Roseimaritima multifibrata]QDS95849.1 Ribonuclease R [Roseimaritima multifibrata]
MEVSKELTDRVLQLIHSPNYQPGKPKQLASALKLDAEETRELKRVIKWLAAQGQLAYGSNHMIISPALARGNIDIVRGSFRPAVGGFGFVRPNSGGTETEAPDDIFIPPGETLGALYGDVVEIRVRGRSNRRGNGMEGTVLKIIERSRRQFTGSYRLENGESMVYLDGVPYEAPISVGDVRGLPVENDDKVVVEMVEFPDAQGKGGEAVIMEVLGSSKNPAIDTIMIMRQYGLPDAFPEAVIDAARAESDRFDDSKVPAERKDLTDLLTITIDPFDARDFDDAISLKHADGRWTLWVHIADVSSFVPAGGPIDAEAYKRGTSVYLPGRVIPMIPEIISNHMASLQPEQIRFTKTVEIEMLDDGTVTSTEVYNAAIRSDKRLNYEQVDQFIANPDDARKEWGEPIVDLLAHMYNLAMTLRKRRLDRGALTMDMPDIKLNLDKQGKVKGAFLAVNTESHQIIEEFMLAGNQAVATWLDDLELNFLHRIHPAPERRKLRQLQQFVKDIGIQVDTLESRFEIQKVLSTVAGGPLEHAVNFAVLRAMNKAIYGPHRDGHYALDMQHYCHFTSPIRRYPDLMVHRLVQKIIDKVPTPDDPFPVLLRDGHHCSDQERNAERAERELIQVKLLHHLKKHVGEKMEAVISRVYPDGLNARCLKLPIEGFIPITALPNDNYRYERRGQVIEGHKELNRFRLGDQLTIQIAKVDVRERQLFLSVIKNHTVAREGKKTPVKKPGKAKAFGGTSKTGTKKNQSKHARTGKKNKTRRR